MVLQIFQYCVVLRCNPTFYNSISVTGGAILYHSKPFNIGGNNADRMLVDFSNYLKRFRDQTNKIT